MNIFSKILRHGLLGSIRIGFGLSWRKLRPFYYQYRFSSVANFVSPTMEELSAIEEDLQAHDIMIQNFTPSHSDFEKFQTEAWFPPDYHGGRTKGVWDEKLLEHWLASDLLGLDEYSSDDIYIDVAAGSSPWAKMQRERRNSSSFAIDLTPASATYSELSYYKIEDATSTSFDDESVRGVSLQCAYEMFMQDDDILLINELARILKVGGKAVILPLYMHTHYCAYATPEYFGKGYSDPNAQEYIRMDCYGVPSSRKYDTNTLKQRVLEPILKAGLKYKLLILRNKETLGTNIYCHFILVIEK